MSNPHNREYKRGFVLSTVIIIEAVLLAIAAVCCLVCKIDLLPALTNARPEHFLLGGLIGVTLSVFGLVMTRVESFKSFHQLVYEIMGPLFAHSRIVDIALIALASGFCEEVFYRGVLQIQFGIVIASLIFGICHFAGKQFYLYVIWATLAGYLFGRLFEMSHSLWLPITAHAVSNFVSIVILRQKMRAADKG
ncbi:MAG: CPBP family intramembrane metalloprotease [Cyanobacteria bacterium TGS_CYA1]|nr:CPBP family intramembrane metalloprotease [Cyanobacteria bacterium TGS_CYA1]